MGQIFVAFSDYLSELKFYNNLDARVGLGKNFCTFFWKNWMQEKNDLTFSDLLKRKKILIYTKTNRDVQNEATYKNTVPRGQSGQLSRMQGDSSTAK